MTHPKMAQPDASGKFGEFGGRYIPETLMAATEELERAYRAAQADPAFVARFEHLLREYCGRPTPLTFAGRLTEHVGGARIYLKREDLNHTGSHKMNNTLGQTLLALRMGKTRIIAETGAGQHGVATATACALFGLQCVVYMGSEDVRRQSLNVFRMRLLGGEVRPVESGSKTLKDATNEAIRDWVTYLENTHYIIGSVVGPHPYPMMVRDFQSVIGRELRGQIQSAEGRLPDAIVACVGGGSNAMGIFHPFIDDAGVALIGVEAGGHGVATGLHSASIGQGQTGVLHGAYSYLMQDGDGQIAPTHSISAGLDYPGVGPEHAWLARTGRARYVPITDDEAMEGFTTLAKLEGIIPALESSHAVAQGVRVARELGRDAVVVINISGRGDKDTQIAAEYLGVTL